MPRNLGTVSERITLLAFRIVIAYEVSRRKYNYTRLEGSADDPFKIFNMIGMVIKLSRTFYSNVNCEVN